MLSSHNNTEEEDNYEMQEMSHRQHRQYERIPSFYTYTPRANTSNYNNDSPIPLRQNFSYSRSSRPIQSHGSRSQSVENSPRSIMKQKLNQTMPAYDEISEYSNPSDYYVCSNDYNEIYNRWDNTELVNRYHRTVSIHRNVTVRESPTTITTCTYPRSLENRRKWMCPSVQTINKTSLEQHANNIANRMEQDGILMEDSLESEQLRREALRDMPQCLTVKRMIKKKLNSTVTKKSKRKPLGFFKNLNYSLSTNSSKFQTNLKSFTYRFELWYSSLKTIEGHFGSAVATYFRFFRWLFIMNFLIMIIIIGFIVTPQLLYAHNEPRPVQNSNVTYDNASSIFVPQNLIWNRQLGRNIISFELHNILTGEGYFENTTLFYGYYTKMFLNIIPSQIYSMPYAYFFTMLCMYAISFIILSISMARSYRRSFIETQGGLKNIYAHKIFCGWDYSIAAQEAADLKCASIYLELKELVSDSIKKQVKIPLLRRFWTGIIQIIVNIIVLVILVAIAYGLWFVLDKHSWKFEGNEKSEELVVTIVIAVIISLIMMFLPPIFSIIVQYEDYKHPRAALYITLIRTFLLKTVVIGVFLAFWLIHYDTSTCWETSIGQHIYRLILFDFLFIVVTAILEILRHIIYKKLWKGIGSPTFDIAKYTLQLMYNQTLFWVGLYFSPLLAVVVVIKLWCTWYIRRTCILHFCQPSSKSWRAAQTHTCFLILSFLSLLLVLITHGYIIVSVPTSKCGPFQDYSYMYELVLKGIFQLEQNNIFWKILMYLTKPGSVALILVAMCVVVYYLRAKAFAQKGMVDILRNMLVLEAQDKEFLLENISKVTGGQWQYNLQDRGATVWKSYENRNFNAATKKSKQESFEYSGDSGSNSGFQHYPLR